MSDTAEVYQTGLRIIPFGRGDPVATDEVLASWNDGPAKQAILGFVDAVTTAGSAFVAPADRIATFDNDGTLWAERGARLRQLPRAPHEHRGVPLGNSGTARTELKAWALPD